MDWINSVWAVIGPYVMEFTRWLVNTGVGASIALLVVKSWSKKHSDENLAETISTKVSNGIVNKDILISLESINKEQLYTIKDELLSKFTNAFEFIDLQNKALSSMAKIMVKFKAATEEEKQDLVKAINAIESKANVKLTVEQKSEPVVIKVESVEDKVVNSDNIF